jgi:hypothetical protein
MKLGDLTHSILHPLAERIIDPMLGTKLGNCGGCAERRKQLNELGDDVLDYFAERLTRRKK